MNIPDHISKRVGLISFYSKENYRERAKLRFELMELYQDKIVTYFAKSISKYVTCNISSFDVNDDGVILIQLTELNRSGLWYATFDDIEFEE